MGGHQQRALAAERKRYRFHTSVRNKLTACGDARFVISKRSANKIGELQQIWFNQGNSFRERRLQSWPRSVYDTLGAQRFGVARRTREEIFRHAWRYAAAGNHEFRFLRQCRQLVEHSLPFGAM